MTAGIGRLLVRSAYGMKATVVVIRSWPLVDILQRIADHCFIVVNVCRESARQRQRLLGKPRSNDTCEDKQILFTVVGLRRRYLFRTAGLFYVMNIGQLRFRCGGVLCWRKRQNQRE